jgi:hypothetical protein
LHNKLKIIFLSLWNFMNFKFHKKKGIWVVYMFCAHDNQLAFKLTPMMRKRQIGLWYYVSQISSILLTVKFCYVSFMCNCICPVTWNLNFFLWTMYFSQLEPIHVIGTNNQVKANNLVWFPTTIKSRKFCDNKIYYRILLLSNLHTICSLWTWLLTTC